jgi:hypothetical protein
MHFPSPMRPMILLSSLAACTVPRESGAPAAEIDEPAPRTGHGDAGVRPVETPPVEHAALVHRVLTQYRSWGPVDSELHWAPGKCDLPNLGEFHESTAPADADMHGGKLFLLYALDITRFARDGWGSDVGQMRLGVQDDPELTQALVKETFRAEPGLGPTVGQRLQDPITGAHGYPPGPIMRDGVPMHAGDPQGSFVMLQLRHATAATDEGWIYATVDADGTVTAAGRIAECEACHRRQADRVFGWADEPNRY